MKKNLAFSFCFLIAMFSLFSCQNEENTTTIDEDEALSKSSPLTNLLQRVAMVDVSSDNIIDSTNCFKVKLPVDVIVNNQPVHIDSEENFATVQQIIDTTDPVEVSVDLVYPITVIFADGQETVIQNQEIRDAIVADCEFGFPNQEPINCININYPITIFGYDSNFQLANTYTIDNDLELFPLIFNFSSSAYYALDYPISITKASGEVVVINNNIELLGAIQTAITECSGPIDPCFNPQVLTNGLIIYMPFASEARDLVSMNFAINNENYPPLFVADRNGTQNSAVSFGGNEYDHLKILATEMNNIEPNDSLTISIWFKMQNLDGGDQEYLFGKLGDFQNGFYMSGFYAQVYDLNTPNFTAPNINAVWDNSWQANNLQNDTTNWHHLVITTSRIPNTNDHSVKLYRDGIERNAGVFSGLFINTQVLDYFIGKDFEGHLDDLRVYRKTLTLEEVQILYNLEGDNNTCLQ